MALVLNVGPWWKTLKINGWYSKFAQEDLCHSPMMCKSSIWNFWEHCSTNLPRRPFRYFSWWLDCTKCCIPVKKPELCLWLLCIVCMVYVSTHDNEPIKKWTSLVNKYMGQRANDLWLLNGKSDSSCCDLWFCEVMLSIKSAHEKRLCYGKIALFDHGWPSCTDIMHCQSHWPWVHNCIPCVMQFMPVRTLAGSFLKPDSHREKVPGSLTLDPFQVPCHSTFNQCVWVTRHHHHAPGHLPVHSFYLSTAGTPNCVSMHYQSTGGKGLNLLVRQVEPIHLEIVFCEHWEAMEVTVKVVDANWSNPSSPWVSPPAGTYVTDLELSMSYFSLNWYTWLLVHGEE